MIGRVFCFWGFVSAFLGENEIVRRKIKKGGSGLKKFEWRGRVRPTKAVQAYSADSDLAAILSVSWELVAEDRSPTLNRVFREFSIQIVFCGECTSIGVIKICDHLVSISLR